MLIFAILFSGIAVAARQAAMDKIDASAIADSGGTVKVIVLLPAAFTRIVHTYPVTHPIAAAKSP